MPSTGRGSSPAPTSTSPVGLAQLAGRRWRGGRSRDRLRRPGAAARPRVRRPADHPADRQQRPRSAPADLDALPWPDPEAWLDAMAQSPLVGDGNPLYLAGSNLYLNRLWLDECQVATELLARCRDRGGWTSTSRSCASGLTQLFREDDPGAGDPDHLQPLAAAAAVLRRVSVIAGGPGTGKTTTVARLLALLEQQAAAQGTTPPLIALAAPTGKAALRLEEAVRSEATELGSGPGHRGTAPRRSAGRHCIVSSAAAAATGPVSGTTGPIRSATTSSSSTRPPWSRCP